MSGIGAPELVILVLVIGVFAVPTLYGLYRAFKTHRTGWAVAILGGWLLGAGWIVGIAFLVGPDRRRRRADST